jgi:hypothetical protein
MVGKFQSIDDAESETEQRAKSILSDRLQQASSRLSEANLRPSALEMDIRNAETRESEIRVYFLQNENIRDAIEFHVFRKGVLVVNLNEIGKWIDGCLDDICKRAISSN